MPLIQDFNHVGKLILKVLLCYYSVALSKNLIILGYKNGEDIFEKWHWTTFAHCCIQKKRINRIDTALKCFHFHLLKKKRIEVTYSV